MAGKGGWGGGYGGYGGYGVQAAGFGAPAAMAVPQMAQHHGPTAGGDGDGDHVAQLKEIQRTDPDGKSQWEAYTDRHGNSVRDPNKHEAEFVWTFISSYKSGVRYEPTHNLSDLFKEGQRRSPSWKSCWAAYCSQNANGVNDPAKHDTHFLQGFLTFLGNAGERMLMGGGGGAVDAPPSKRMNVGSGVAVTTTTGSKSKDQLVQTIKLLQRQNESVKEIWGSYCDTHFGGLRDPARQDSAALETFLQLHGFGVNYDAGKPVVSTGDTMKDALVNKIKQFQRQGETQKETWGTYADEHLGGRRDPARHDSSVLQNFVNLYGL